MTLYLLPNVFDDAQSPLGLLPEGVGDLLQSLHGLIAESERTGRRYLLKLLPQSPIARSIPIVLLNEHSKPSEYDAIANMIMGGEKWGLMSDAGMPVIADPGSYLVEVLRKKGFSSIRVISGPSSILVALLLSGFNGQKFFFHGYLPQDSENRRKALKELEREASRAKATQICIEAPYRNNSFFADCLAVLNETTNLCIACRLTFADEWVEVRTVKEWRRRSCVIRKEPTVFLIESKLLHGTEGKR